MQNLDTQMNTKNTNEIRILNLKIESIDQDIDESKLSPKLSFYMDARYRIDNNLKYEKINIDILNIEKEILIYDFLERYSL